MNWLLSSSIGRKLIMSISGIFLVLFLLFHMSMNLVLVISAEAYNWIGEMLGANWYAVAATLILGAGVATHFIYGTWLTLLNQKARGSDKYAYSSKTETEWSAKNMYVLGVIILIGLLIHMWNFWYKMQFSELFHLEGAITQIADPVIQLFSNPMYSIVYIVWLGALWFHLTHGVWSAFQTLGWNGKVWFSRLKIISNVVATVIMIGFAIVPVFFTIKAFITGSVWWGI
ncbi:MAG: succinate dehydrogenase/fumarate reductase cytochrome b subunit [Dysgonamonadaceae bacterium]|jgi:succinate dehydrogenase / fumarate reductase cytochrome b subunit|nr:succinate dehydrogenase/fumarate reductase cytochrome b subunit [Dysgonamonadaceae bacterium]